MLKLKLQNFGHITWRADSLEKTDPRKDWRQKEKGETEDEMVGRHHWLNGHEFEQILGDDEGQGNLVSMRLQRVGHDWGTEQQHGLWPVRLLYAWDFPRKNSGVCCRILLQRIFPTQGSNPHLLHFRWILYHWATRKASIDRNSEECNRID